MEKILTGELLANLYLTLDADEKAFFFNTIGSSLIKNCNAELQRPTPDLLGGSGRKAIKSFTDLFFAARLDERSAAGEGQITI